MEDAKPANRIARLWVLAEAGLICGLGLLAIFWLIPAETTGGGIGLASSTLPTVCIVATMILILTDAVVRFLGRSSPLPALLPAAPALRVIALCVLCAVLLKFMNPALASLFLLPPLMLLLGERNWLRIAATTVVTASVLAAALVWRG